MWMLSCISLIVLRESEINISIRLKLHSQLLHLQISLSVSSLSKTNCSVSKHPGMRGIRRFAWKPIAVGYNFKLSLRSTWTDVFYRSGAVKSGFAERGCSKYWNVFFKHRAMAGLTSTTLVIFFIALGKSIARTLSLVYVLSTAFLLSLLCTRRRALYVNQRMTCECISRAEWFQLRNCETDQHKARYDMSTGTETFSDL